MEQACIELRESVRLRKLLGIILSLGNRVESANEGRKDKVAAGLYLDSLAKLSQVKAFDKEKTSFLHYVVKVVERNNADVLSFGELDLASVLKADRISWTQHQEQMRVTTERIKKIRSLALQQAQLSIRSSDSHFHNDEVLLLRATRVGMFVVNASKTLCQIRVKTNEIEEKSKDLMRYFQLEKNTSISHIFSIVTDFIRSVDRARNENKVRKKNELVHTLHDVVDAANSFAHLFVDFSSHVILCLPVSASVALHIIVLGSRREA